MSVIVKIMGGENLPDEDPRKTFQLFTNVEDVSFDRVDDGACDILMRVPRERKLTASLTEDPTDIKRRPILGNVYVMNEAGKTISTFNADMRINQETAGSNENRGVLPLSGRAPVPVDDAVTPISKTFSVLLNDHLFLTDPLPLREPDSAYSELADGPTLRKWLRIPEENDLYLMSCGICTLISRTNTQRKWALGASRSFISIQRS